MFFFLATSEYNYTQSNTTKVKVHLSTGVAEIYDRHQDLIGKIDNDIVEIESTIENKTEKKKFIVQEGIFLVSTKNSIAADPQNTETTIYVYAKRAKEINAKNALDEILKEYEIKKDSLQKAEQEAEEKGLTTVIPKTDTEKMIFKSSKIYLLKEEVDFLKKVLFVSKEMK